MMQFMKLCNETGVALDLIKYYFPSQPLRSYYSGLLHSCCDPLSPFRFIFLVAMLSLLLLPTALRSNEYVPTQGWLKLM
jgi:hypothetical protein